MRKVFVGQAQGAWSGLVSHSGPDMMLLGLRSPLHTLVIIEYLRDLSLLWVIPIIVAMLDIKIKFLELIFVKNNSKPITCQHKLYVLSICSQTKKNLTRK